MATLTDNGTTLVAESREAAAGPVHCEHKWRLLAEVADAIKWLNSLESAKTRALVRDDQPEVRRLELQIEHGRELKEDIWEALLGHITVHGC